MKHRVDTKKTKVIYSSFDYTHEIKKYLEQLSKIAKLNLLLEKELITKIEYEKVKYAIEKNA